MRLDADARHCLEVPERIADAFIGEVFAASGRGGDLATELSALVIQAGQAADGDKNSLLDIINRTKSMLSVDLPAGKSGRKPFHWPLEFPEVFESDNGGFDAILGNPPFLGGGEFAQHLDSHF